MNQECIAGLQSSKFCLNFRRKLILPNFFIFVLFQLKRRIENAHVFFNREVSINILSWELNELHNCSFCRQQLARLWKLRALSLSLLLIGFRVILLVDMSVTHNVLLSTFRTRHHVQQISNIFNVSYLEALFFTCNVLIVVVTWKFDGSCSVFQVLKSFIKALWSGSAEPKIDSVDNDRMYKSSNELLKENSSCDLFLQRHFPWYIKSQLKLVEIIKEIANVNFHLLLHLEVSSIAQL